MDIYEPWVARNSPLTPASRPNSPHFPHPSLSEDIFPWAASQTAEAHIVLTGLVDCITILTDFYPQVNALPH